MAASGSARGWTWRVFATCWLVYTALWTPYIVREHFPALALLERGSMNVERYLGWSEDIFAGPEGGAYINNNPGASLTAAAGLIPLRPWLRSIDEWNQKLPRTAAPERGEEVLRRMSAEGRTFYFLAIAFLTVALVMAPATAGAAAYLCSRLAQAGIPPVRSAQAALLYGLGTPVLFRALYLNHNLLVCDAGLTALLLLWDPRNAPVRALHVFGAGLLAGYAVLCDYSGIVLLAVVALYVFLRSAGQPAPARWKWLAAFAAGAAPGILALAAYQAWAFGSLYRPSQHYMTPTAPTSHGYRGIDWPSPSLLWANFFDPRFGLFAWCPALLLAFAAPFVKRVRYRVPAPETAVLFIYFGLMVLFCAANQYSWLQPSTGFRYLVPVVPALALLAIQAAQILPCGLRWAIAAGSCAQSLIMAAAYRNTFGGAVSSLWERRFELPWMIRLDDAGVAVTWVWPAGLLLIVALAIAAVWLLPRKRTRGPNALENRHFFFTRTGGLL